MQHWPALLTAALLALMHLEAWRLSSFHHLPRSRWLSAAGGASVAYVFLHLLPELAAISRSVDDRGIFPYLDHHIFFVSLLGLVTFYGLECLARRHGPRANDEEGEEENDGNAHPESTSGRGLLWVHLSAFALYNFIIGWLLPGRQQHDLADLILYAAAIGLHLLINDHSLRSASRRRLPAHRPLAFGWRRTPG